jgi:hypothetical protein
MQLYLLEQRVGELEAHLKLLAQGYLEIRSAISEGADKDFPTT